MSKLSKYIPIALFLGFLFVGLVAFFASKPTPKNKRVYNIVKEYSPYYIEKTLGGLRIRKKGDKEFKEEPTNAEFFKRYEFLEREWGQKHLKLNGNKLTIINNGKELQTIDLKDANELHFVKKYYGVGQ